MAPRGSKRPAAASLAARKRRVNPSMQQCSVVVAALYEAKAQGGVPEMALEMLGSMVESSLGVYRDQRHAYQEEIVAMVGKAISGSEAVFQAAATDSASKVGPGQASKTTREARRAEAGAALTALKAAKAAQEEASEAAKQNLKAADEALHHAKASADKFQKDLLETIYKKEQLTKALQEDLMRLKEAKADTRKDSMKAVLSVARNFALDTSMVESLAMALRKAPDARTAFDLLGIQQTEAAFTKHIGLLDLAIKDSQPVKAEREAAVDSAKKAHDDATQVHAGCVAALAEANAAQKEGGKAFRSAEDDVANYLDDIKALMDNADKAQEQLDAFRRGAVAAYCALQDMETPPPPPPSPVEEEQAPEVDAAPAVAETAPAPETLASSV